MRPETHKLIEDQETIKKRYKQKRTSTAKKNWHSLQKQVSASFERDQADHLDEKISKLELAAKRREYGTVWQVISHISNKQIKVDKLDGSVPENDKQLLTDRRTYFSTLTVDDQLSWY